MAVVLGQPSQTCFIDGVTYVERRRTEVTDRNVVADSRIQGVIVTLFVFEFGNPLSGRAVENDFDCVAVGFGKLLCRFQTVLARCTVSKLAQEYHSSVMRIENSQFH